MSNLQFAFSNFQALIVILSILMLQHNLHAARGVGNLPQGYCYSP